MLENLPQYISLVFSFTTIVTLFFFFLIIFNSKDFSSKLNVIILALTLWLILQMILSFFNFYNSNTQSFPPRFLLLILPPFLTIILLFSTSAGKNFIDSLPLVYLTLLNIVRIPVEIVLYWLFLNKTVPEIMTFHGNNFDIFSGITAPIIAYFGIHKKFFNKKIILTWNFIALALLLNIVITAIFSAPFPFQKFAFEQPNIAVLYFPFSWLPGFIVPVVLFTHLASIRILIKEK